MIRIAAVYPFHKGKHFDLEYYLNVHLVQVREKFSPYGLIKIEVDKPLGSPGGAPSPFFAVGYLYFPTLQHFQEAFTKVGREVISDIIKYTDVVPMIQVGEIQLAEFK